MIEELEPALLLLKSSKKKDRNDAFQKLTALIGNTRVEKHIGINTSRKKGVTWTTVFSAAHVAAVSELSSGKTSAKAKSEMSSLITQVAEKARGFIKTETLTEAVFEVLGSDALIADLGRCYADIATNHLLERPNRRDLLPKHWKKLTELCTEGYKTPSKWGGIKREKYLDLLWKTVKWSQDSVDLITLLPFLEEAVRIATVPSAQRLLLLIANTCLEAAAADNRYRIAEFLEAVIPSILQFYGAGRDFNNLLFQFFTIALNVHHPKGADEGSEMFHAADLQTWKKELEEMLKVCQTEVVHICRVGHETSLPQHFLPFLVDLAYLLRNSTETTNDGTRADRSNSPLTICNTRKRKSVDTFGVTQTQKRARMVCVLSPLTVILADMDTRDRWFWLNYLDTFIDRHPSIVNAEYLDLVQNVAHLLCEVRRHETFSPLSRCAAKLLSRFSYENATPEARKTIMCAWEKSLESLVRAGLENLPDQFYVIQMMIQNLKINATPVVNAFLNNEMVVTAQSLGAMYQIVCVGGVKNEEERCAIAIKALGNLGNPEEMARLAIALLSKQVSSVPSPSVRNSDSRGYEDIYFFVTLKEVVAQEPTKEERVTGAPSVYQKVANCILESARQHSNSILEKLAVDPDDSSMDQCIIFLKFMVLLANEFWETPSSDFQMELAFTIRSLLSKLTSVAARLIINGKISMEPLTHLYSLDLHAGLREELQAPNYTDPSLIENTLSFVKQHWRPVNPQSIRMSADSKVTSIIKMKYSSPFDRLKLYRNADYEKSWFGRGDWTPEDSHLLQAVELLTQYFMFSGSSASDRLMYDLITFLADDTECKYDSQFQLQLMVRAVLNLCCCQLDCENLEKCIGILFDIVSDYHQDTAVHVIVLAVLLDRLPHVKSRLNQDAVQCITRLLIGFRRILKERNQTPLDMVLSYLKLLKEMCSDPLKFFNADGNEIVMDIIGYLGHKCVEVRVVASEALVAVIQIKSLDAQWHRKVMELVKTQLADVSDMVGYDKIAFAGTSLAALTSAFVTSRLRRLSIANLMLKFVKDSNSSNFVITNLLDYCSSQLRVEDSSKYFVKHLKDLIVDWLEEGRALSEFPFQLLRCTNAVDFYKKYCHIIAAICFLMLKIDALTTMSSQIGMSVGGCLERGFPLIKARTTSQDFQKIQRYISVAKIEEILESRLDECIYFEIVETGKPSRGTLQLAFERLSAIQKLLLLLEEGFVESITEEDCVEALSRYKMVVELYFTSRLSENAMPADSERDLDCDTYIFRDAVSVALRGLSAQCNRTTKILEMLCELLKLVIDSSLHMQMNEMDHALPGITNGLVAVASGNKVNAKPVLKLLRYLIVDCRHALSSSIALLDPFPDEDQFSGLVVPDNLNLRHELERIVEGFKGRRVAGLTRLLKALESQKEELLVLYSAVDEEGKTRRGKLLQEAVHELLQLCAHQDQAVRVEAAKCLGELGPADLGLLMTRSKDLAGKATVVPIAERMVQSVLLHLKNLIETEGLVVKRAACDALYAAIKYTSLESQCSTFYAPFIHVTLQPLAAEANTDIAPPYSIWSPGIETSHEVWVTNLSTALLELLADNLGLIELLRKLCQLHSPTANYLLPFALEMVLTVGCSALQRDIVKSVNFLLSAHLAGKSGLTIKSALAVVEAIDYIRCYSFRSGAFDFLPQLDKLMLAEVAGECGAHFISIMYCELWFEEQKNAAYIQNPNIWTYTVDDLDECGRHGPFSRIMRTAFVNVGLLDGLLGCGRSHLADSTEILKHMEQMGRWDVALVGHDVAASASGIVRSLRHNGLHGAISLLPAADQDTKLSCASLLSDWSQVLPADSSPSFQRHHYAALKFLHEQESPSALVEIEKATDILVDHISSGRAGSARNLYCFLAQLRCLKELRDITEARSEVAVATLARKWSIQDEMEPNNFSFVEEILTTRCVAINQVAQMDSAVGWNDVAGEIHLRLCQLARKYNRHDVVLRNSQKLRMLPGSGDHHVNRAKMEEAQYFWAQGEQNTASFLMKKLLNQSLDATLKAKCERIYGNWLAQTKAESEGAICKIFMTSMSASTMENFIETCAALAKFSDSLFIQKMKYRESSEFLLRRETISQRKEAFANIANVAEKSRKQAVYHDLREAKIDEEEINTFENELRGNLVCAVRHYSLTLRAGNQYDHLVFRLVSLLMNCPEWERQCLDAIIAKELPKIPSYKFVTLLPQIAPRMHENNLLVAIVERCLVDHPHQTLPIVMAMKHAHVDAVPEAAMPDTPSSLRQIYASNLLSKVSVIPHLQPLVNEIEAFFGATIALANIKDAAGVKSAAVPEEIIATLQNLQNVLIPTMTLTPQPTKVYGNIVGISHIHPTYDLVGGVNKPKKVILFGTDGKQHCVLVKGNDDPRQDAMIQQLFQVMNEVLSRDEAAARQQLRMRTYHVMPLTQRSGVLQWCADTQPLALYLTGANGKSGAHVRFRKDDINPIEARRFYMEGKDLDAVGKLQRFRDICAKIKPVLHYFFLENFPSADVAFEKRLAFTRSVATSSMIGYILGLGDRHLSNMLISNPSGEVIHIDFGIAFEMGKTLVTPETVPFRLTRDIVDGMGICGVDGLFRSSCQQTMTVLREHKDVIITLLEVLLYDPLCSWATNDSGESSTNARAARALQRVTIKLQGMEDRGQATVEGQISGLLQKAQDPHNLCRLFHGWQPYL